MAILRWRPGQAMERLDPFRDLSDIRSEMNRLFDTVFGRSVPMGVHEGVWAPAVDMYETKNDLVVAVELPGVNEKEINLSITGDVLTLRGERAQSEEVKQDSFHRGERWVGKFERTLPLPFPVQADKVNATYRDGVLTIRLPKAEEIRPREIKIEVA